MGFVERKSVLLRRQRLRFHPGVELSFTVCGVQWDHTHVFLFFNKTTPEFLDRRMRVLLQESQEADGPVVFGEKPVSVSQEDLQEVLAMGA